MRFCKMLDKIMNKYSELQLIFDTLALSSNNAPIQIPDNLDWDKVYKLLLRHRVWYQALSAFKLKINEVPSNIYSKIAEYCNQKTLLVLATTAETCRIANSFTKNRLLHCFVKGIVLNIHIYGGLATRSCKDIDILVAQENYKPAIQLLLELGYQKVSPNYEMDSYQEKYYLNHHHDMIFYHPEKKVQVELHYKLEKFGMPWFNLSDAITQTILIGNVPITTLEDNYHLLYLMIHASQHGWIRLRWLFDIVLYLNSNKIDMQKIYALAEDIGCKDIVEQSLLLVQNNFGKHIISLSNLISNPTQRTLRITKMAEKLISSEFEISPITSIYQKSFYDYRIYLLTLAPIQQTFKIFLGGFIAIDKLFPYISFPKKLTFLYYLICPLFTLKRLVTSFSP